MELIKVTESNGQSVVSARDLHVFLEVKTDFTDWMKRMLAYGFEELTDYSLLKIGERSAHNKIDYALTLDTAKEISMIQRSDKGRQARKYFIECEKIAKQSAALPTLLQQMEQERAQLSAQRDEIDAKLAKITNATRYITGETEMDEWRQNFIEKYGQPLLSFIEVHMPEWIARRSIKVRAFRDQLSSYGIELGVKTIYIAIKEYCYKHSIFVELGRQSKHGAGNYRIHIFAAKKS